MLNKRCRLIVPFFLRRQMICRIISLFVDLVVLARFCPVLHELVKLIIWQNDFQTLEQWSYFHLLPVELVFILTDHCPTSLRATDSVCCTWCAKVWFSFYPHSTDFSSCRFSEDFICCLLIWHRIFSSMMSFPDMVVLKFYIFRKRKEKMQEEEQLTSFEV